MKLPLISVEKVSVQGGGKLTLQTRRSGSGGNSRFGESIGESKESTIVLCTVEKM